MLSFFDAESTVLITIDFAQIVALNILPVVVGGAIGFDGQACLLAVEQYFYQHIGIVVIGAIVNHDNAAT